MEIGDRIELIETDDPYTSLKRGDMGTVDFINPTSFGKQIGVKWDNGSRLMLIEGKDSFIKR